MKRGARSRAEGGKRRARSRARGGGRAVLAAACILLSLAGAYLWLLGGPTPPAPTIGGAWTLTRGDGERVTDRDFRGRYVLLYFGYTSCPDVCPTTLASVAQAMRDLGPKAARMQPLFVTVDPRRDTPAIVHDYVRSFGAGLIGLTGTPEQIRTIEREYDISSIVRPAGSNGAYSIDHTAVLILLDPEGRYVAPLPAEENAGAIARRLSRYLT